PASRDSCAGPCQNLVAAMSASLRARIRCSEPTVGTFVNLGSVMAAEACALAGFDWLVVDLEHGAGGEDALLGQVLAAGIHEVPVIVRVESAQRIRSGRVLDLGAAGVMFPRLDSAEEVANAARHLRYPPEGDRGVAIYDAPEFQPALAAVVRAAQSAGVPAGILTPDRDRALECVEAGFTFV